MNDIKETWNKWDYVCPDCDSHIEMTIKSNGHPHNDWCPKCIRNVKLTLLSVVDATIDPTTKKEEEMNLTETPAPTITITVTDENDNQNTYTYGENDVRAMYWNNKHNAKKQNEWYLKESKLRNLLEEVYADSEDQEILSQIAEIFDVPLTKEIEVTIYVRVDATIEVDMANGDYDLEDLVSNNLTVDSYDSIVSINNHEVERVEEGRY